MLRALPNNPRARVALACAGSFVAGAGLVLLRRRSGAAAKRGAASLSSAGAIWTMLNELGSRPGALSMSQGFPDFPGSEVARTAAAAAVTGGEVAHNQYAPIVGTAELRAAVSAFYERRYGVAYDPASEIVVTTSGQEALVSSIKACVARTGRRGVVVLEPFFPFVAPAVAAAGGYMQPARLGADFAVDAAALDAAIDGDTACALLNSPHNPTGHVCGAAELDAVAEVCVRRDVLAISDEVYEHAVWNGEHRRLADAKGMFERTITLSSAGKLFSLTGWRVGWALAPRDLAADVAGAHSAFTFCAPTPLQHGVAKALDAEDGTFGGVAGKFARNFAKLAAALEARGLDVCPADGGYFLVANAKEPAMAFVERLAGETGVVCTPLSVFYASPPPDCTHVRFTICKSEAYVDRVVAALRGK